jgi:hypothetical protein
VKRKTSSRVLFDVEALVGERVGALRELSRKHLLKVDEFTTVVVKGHLVLEQYLMRMISVYCRLPKYLEEARLSFWQKIQLAKGFIFFPIEPDLWRAIELMNSIRNDVAHNLESPKLAGHIAEVRKLRCCSPTSKEIREALKTDRGAVELTIGYCIGALQFVDATIATMERDKNERWKKWLAKPRKGKRAHSRSAPTTESESIPS